MSKSRTLDGSFNLGDPSTSLRYAQDDTPYFSGLIKLISISLCLFALTFFPSANADGYQVTDSFGKHWFRSPPTRVVVTDWTLLEQLLSLGITPIGAPELDRYQHYSSVYPLPSTIADIGARQAPNLNAIRALKPDLIILGTNQKDLTRPLSHIARVMYYKHFSERYRTNGTKSRTRLVQIAALFQKEAHANTLLKQFDTQLTHYKNQLATQITPSSSLPSANIIRVTGNDSFRVYGKNSLANHVLSTLGINNPITIPLSQYGMQSHAIDAVSKLKGDVIFVFDTQDYPDFFTSPHWQSLSQTSPVITLSKQWSYGGYLALQTLAEEVTHGVLAQVHAEEEN